MDTENSPVSSVDASDLSLEQTFARSEAREPLTEVQVCYLICFNNAKQHVCRLDKADKILLQRSIRFCDSPGDSTQKSSLRPKTPSAQVYRIPAEAEAESTPLGGIKAVLLWHNSAVSALAFLCGCLTCLAIDFGLNGSHGLNFVTGERCTAFKDYKDYQQKVVPAPAHAAIMLKCRAPGNCCGDTSDQ